MFLHSVRRKHREVYGSWISRDVDAALRPIATVLQMWRKAKIHPIIIMWKFTKSLECACAPCAVYVRLSVCSQQKSFKRTLVGVHSGVLKRLVFQIRQRLWLRLGVNVDDQLWLRLNPIHIPNCNPSANPSPSRNTNTNPNPNRPTTPLLTLTDPLTITTIYKRIDE